MTRAPAVLKAAVPLLAACLATAVAVGAWRGERALSEGRTAQRRGQFAAADSFYRKALESGNADAALERARLQLLRRDWEGSGESLRAAMSLVPARALPHLLWARLLSERPGPWDRSREEQVLRSCRRAVVADPLRADLRRDCADIALALFRRAQALGGARPDAPVLEEAAGGYAAALALDPAAAGRTLEGALMRGGDPAFLTDVVFRSGDAVIQSALVGLLADRSLWAQDAPGVWAAAEGRGNLPAFAAAAAKALARRSLLREALEATSRGLAAAPGDRGLAESRADLTARLPGDEALPALEMYRDLLAADPGNAVVRRRFAGFLVGRGMTADAEREARFILGGDAKDAEAWFLLGESLRRSGRPAEAVAAFRAAADLRPANAAYRRASGRK